MLLFEYKTKHLKSAQSVSLTKYMCPVIDKQKAGTSNALTHIRLENHRFIIYLFNPRTLEKFKTNPSLPAQ